MAKQFTNVIGVEENSEAIGFAKQNKARASATNIEFKRDRVCDFLKGLELSKTDFALIDPPRFGAEDQTIELIAKMACYFNPRTRTTSCSHLPRVKAKPLPSGASEKSAIMSPPRSATN